MNNSTAADASIDGILLVDKPMGPTSHDLVNRIRKHFSIPKVGHGGTLDPMASGLMILLLGRGTKLSDRFLGSDKTYAGSLTLGQETDSLDATGEIQAEAPFDHVTASDLEREMTARRGDSLQTPPMVSAVKVNGVPLYKHARKGKTVARKPRLIHIYRFALLGYEPPIADFELQCTKGTYVRVLCAEIGQSLGCGAHLSRLRRTRSGNLHIQNAIPFHDVMQLSRAELARHVLPISQFP